MLRKTTLVAALAILLLALAPSAAAHKTAYSPDGKIKIVWGFLNEPAVTMTKNGLDLRITDNATNYNIPDLQSNLHVAITYGDLEHEFEDLSGQFGKPGYYTGVITPTKPGLYTLHVSGTVNGTELDMEIPAAHEMDDINDTYFPSIESGDLAAKVSALEAKVAALEAKAKAQAETPATVTGTPTKGVPGFEPVLALVGLAAVALVLLRRKA